MTRGVGQARLDVVATSAQYPTRGIRRGKEREMAYFVDKVVPGKAGKTRKVYIARWKQGGKTREKSFAKLSEAKNFAAEMQNRFESADALAPKEVRKTINFADLSNEYLAALEAGFDGADPLEPQTLRTYRLYIESHLIPEFSFYSSVRGINTGSIETLRDKLARPEYERQRLAPKTIRELLRLSKAVLSYGVKQGYLEVVPGKDITLKPTRKEKTAAKIKKDEGVFTPEQVAALLHAADDLARDRNLQIARAWAIYRPMAYLLAHTGMRISEARGFPRASFDKKANLIRIRQRASEEGEIGNTKSAEGVRDIPLHPDLIEPMESVLRLSEHDLVFAGATGKPRNYQNLFNRMLKPLIKRANKLAKAEGEAGVGVPDLGFHAIRHAFAARLIGAGANLKQLQSWMGHHDPAFTLKEYGHLFSDDGSAASVMANMTLPQKHGKSMAKNEIETSLTK